LHLLKEKENMVAELARNWWVVALRGVLAIIFGVLALLWPAMTLAVLVILFGAYVLVDGIFAVIGGFSMAGQRERWWVMVLEGIAGIIIGLITFFSPGVTALVLLYYIAAWAIITGVLEIVTAIRLRREIEGEWAMGLAGAASILLGVFLIIQPGAGAIGLIWWIGSLSIVFGVLLVVLAFRLRGLADRIAPA
jgi:uncharacterized membrane protein HdeD (DUF308 family)